MREVTYDRLDTLQPDFYPTAEEFLRDVMVREDDILGEAPISYFRESFAYGTGDKAIKIFGQETELVIEAVASLILWGARCLRIQSRGPDCILQGKEIHKEWAVEFKRDAGSCGNKGNYCDIWIAFTGIKPDRRKIVLEPIFYWYEIVKAAQKIFNSIPK